MAAEDSGRNGETASLDPVATGLESPHLTFSMTQRIRLLVAAAIAVGLLLRLRQFLHARSLWLDEASLAVSLIDLPAGGLLEPLLANRQMAPPGFLWLERISIHLLGTSEQALRLVPLLAGLVALALLFPVARRYAGTRAAVFVIWFGALSQHLVYYSNEVKQYSSDVAFALLLLWLAHRAAERETRWYHWTAFAAIGAIAVWFSHPAAFVLASSGVVLTVVALRRGDRTATLAAAGVATAWLASFAVLFAVVAREQIGNQFMLDYWSRSFLPFPPTSAADFAWFHDQFYRLFRNPVGLRTAGLAGAAFAVGVVSWSRWGTFHTLGLMLGPIIVTAGVSAAGIYPFASRLLLFLVPVVLIVVARGLVASFDASPTVGVAMTAFLLATPVVESTAELRSPTELEDIRSVLERVAEVSDEGDTFIVHYSTVNAFRYYRHRGVIPAPEFRVFGDWQAMRSWQREHMDRLDELVPEQGRFWILYTFRAAPARRTEETLLLRRAAELGTEVVRFDSQGAGGVLFTATGGEPAGPEE